MKYSSKQDLVKYLTKLNIAPVETTAILDYRHTPTGQWVLSFDKEIPLLSETDDSGRQNGSTTVLSDGIVLRKLPDSEHLRLMLTSPLKISNRTICVHMIPPYFKMEHVRHMFDGYDVAPSGVRAWTRKTPSHTSSYLVDFVSSEEAERACREQSCTIHDGSIVKITWYNV